MDKTKYIKWYKIAEATINDESMIPARKDEEILDYVSQEDWLMFLPEGVNKEQGKSREDPNVYFYIRNEKSALGLTFNNVKAVDKIKNLLSPYSSAHREAIVNKMLSLDNKWGTVLNRKIHEKNHKLPPRYVQELRIKSNSIDNEKIIEIFTLSNMIREEGRKKRIEKKIKENLFYREVPGIDLMEINLDLSEEEFKKRIIEVFDVLKICSDVKSDMEIKKIQKDEQKLVSVIQCINCGSIFSLNTGRTICGKISCGGSKLEKVKIPKIEYETLLRNFKVKE